MKSLYAARIITAIPKFNSPSSNNIPARTNYAVPAFNFLVSSYPIVKKSVLFQSETALRSQSASNPETHMDDEEDPDAQVQNLTVPKHYLAPSKALEESEWLRVTLHKWLDDEYCPEPTNMEISKIAAQSYYEALLEKQTDLGEILLKMAMELETISYQESFHGAFSSANAAVSLIAQKIEQA